MKPPKVLSRGTEFGSTCVGAVVLFLQLILHTESGILPLIRAASPQSWRSVGGSSCSLHTPRSQLFTTALLILRAHWHKGHLPTCSPSTFIITVIISSTHLSASFKQFLTGDIYHWGAAFPQSNWPPATLDLFLTMSTTLASHCGTKLPRWTFFNYEGFIYNFISRR